MQSVREIALNRESADNVSGVFPCQLAYSQDQEP